MCGSGQLPALPADAGEAMVMVRAGLTFLASAEVASLPAGAQAGLLRDLERAQSAHTAARSRVLSAFTAQAGFEADGHQSAKAWLAWQTRVTGGAAAGAMGWMRRLAVHPRVAEALAAGEISESWGRQLCVWSDLLPPDRRGDADQILLDAAAGGAGLADLSGLAEEMFRRSAPPDRDGDDDGFTDRSLRLDVLDGGGGRLTGDLTGACAAALAAAVASVGKKAGPEDTRTQVQRDHDALEEICRRLVAAGDLSDVAGQPAQIQLQVTLDQLRGLPGAASAEQAWLAGRAAGDGQAGWLGGQATVAAYACDAAITPLVTGHVDQAALAAMAQEFRTGSPAAAAALTPATMARLQDTLLRYAADVLSGPAGLASFLRTGLPGPQAPAVSLPLDVGTAVRTVPPYLRRAVIHRDRHCGFPGCRQRPAGCQVHHIIPRSRGGPTALTNLLLLCSFHHLIAIHRWGWTITLHGDGTTTATSPDRIKILHSHSPPAAAA